MFVAMAMLFTFHAPRGAFYHAAPAWLPFALPMAVASVPGACATMARWWRFLGRRRTQSFVLFAGLAGAVVLSLVGSLAIYAGWREDRMVDETAGRLLAEIGDTDAVVMSDDPASLWQVSGHPGIPMPADPYPVVEQAIRAYDVEWVVVSLRHGASEDPLGLWEGAESIDADGNAATFLESDPALEGPNVRVFRVR
jgi:hypothetical protein